jgi:phage baseplate assembly protein W
MLRHDYAFPLRIGAGSSQVAQADYAAHIDQLLRQLLLTSPGERVCLPEFGCGLRRLVFATQSDALAATTRIQIQQAISRWLPDQVRLDHVDVQTGATADPTLGLEPGALQVTIAYTIIDTLTPASLTLTVV